MAEPVEESTPGRGRRRILRTIRVEAFSDAVFAIAITLLVLDLPVPAKTGNTLQAFLDEWPSYLAYVVSFSTIGALWLGHTFITEYLTRVDAGFMRRNLLMLLVVSFLPFPTKLLSEYISSSHAERVATTVYGLALMASVAMLSVLWRYALRHELLRADAEEEEVRELTERFTPGLAAYLGLIGLGLLVPIAAVFGYLVLAVFLLTPVQLPGKRRRSG